MYYVYILYSERTDRYYVGHTSDPERRLIEHNSTNENKFTTKYRPWEMLLFFKVSESRGEVMKMEKFIKKQKSRLFLNRLIEAKENPEYFSELLKDVLG
jgi:putative endonuclease